jgi:hypothetical protein
VSRTPSAELDRIAELLRQLAERLRAAEEGEPLYSKGDVDRIVSGRLAREQAKTRRAERERDELEEEISELRGQSDS